MLVCLVCLRAIEIHNKKGNLQIKFVDVDDLYVNFHIINEKAVILDVNATLEVIFKASGNIERRGVNRVVFVFTYSSSRVGGLV